MARHESTHEVCLDPRRKIVTKRFRSWGRQEPVREWTALTLLAELAPGLAAVPLRADLNARPPAIQMSWLPGDRLSDSPLSGSLLDGLAHALERLWQPVPSARWPTAVSTLNSAALAGRVRATVASRPQMGEDPLAGLALRRAAAWLGRSAVGSRGHSSSGAILGQGDPNLANFLWDGDRVRVVDFEDSGPSGRAFELAILVEHLSAWSAACLDADAVLSRFGLTAAEQASVREFRRLAALFWLLLLRPGGPSSRRNPPGTLHRQADRLLALLG